MANWLAERCRVLWNRPVAERTWRMGLDSSAVALRIRPGQFFMVRLDREDPLLGRPYALYQVVEWPSATLGKALEFVYLVVGRQTALLTELRPGDELDIWGPLGNGFDVLPDSQELWLVAGGIGQTPFLALLQEITGARAYGLSPDRARPRWPIGSVRMFYGARSARYLACLGDFKSTGVRLSLATDDGSVGYAGPVTEPVAAELARVDASEVLVVGCGPEPMLRRLADVCRERGARCFLSLETPMACGYGACFSCVVSVRTGDGHDYRRVCVDGPVFDAEWLVEGGSGKAGQ